MLDSYRLRMQQLGGYEGEARRRSSQKIMDASWMRDASTKPVYVKWVDKGLPEICDYDVPVYAKYNVKTYHNITGDEVAYLLQFRLDDLKKRPDIKIGSYVQIRNEMDEPEWWLIVHFDDRTQFRQFSILKCTWIYKWVSFKEGHRIIHECLGCPRKQNSYNSGVWLDYLLQTVENQDVFWVPTNSDTQTIGYDTGFLKSEDGRYPPLKYKVSKVEDTAVKGITRFVMTQEQFNPEYDNADLMIADYYKSYIEPTPEQPTESEQLVFKYTNNASVRAGGSYKKFTLKYINENNEQKDIVDEITWQLESGDMDIGNIEMLIDNNVIKVKCVADYSLIGKTFDIIAICSYGLKKITVEVISL